MDPKSTKILIVDDEVQLLELLQMEFEEDDFLVKTAESVDAAIEIIKVDCPHLILSDLKMPCRSGKELLAYVRENHPEVRFLFMSGHAESSDPDVSGVEHFFQKPFSLQSVVEQVKSLLNS